MKRTNNLLVPKFRTQDFDQREAINLKEKITFTILFSVIFGVLGLGIYSVCSWAYQAISNLI
ncbi:MAG: hypothetical protein K0R65_601 [Crocinitomicaceae bacterium]|jgi:nitrate reductase NapE component|nr:hypothetical protein [Crocinitomicaceae bacterium]